MQVNSRTTSNKRNFQGLFRLADRSRQRGADRIGERFNRANSTWVAYDI